MRIDARIVIALALVSTGSLVRAEPETGTRIDPHRGSVGSIDRVDAATAARVMNTFGRCAARNEPRIAETILALPLLSDEQHSTTRRFFGRGREHGCLGVGDRELRFRPPLLVGAMAEWFIIDRYENGDVNALAGLSDEQQAELGLAPRSGFEDVAICTVVRDPAGIRALVETRPASDAENAAFTRVIPHVGACLPAGMEFNFSRPSLRALLSAGLYRALSVVSGRQSPERRN